MVPSVVLEGEDCIEPTPLVPARSDRVRVQSHCCPGAVESPIATQSQPQGSATFGPRGLSRCLPLPRGSEGEGAGGRDCSPAPPSEYSACACACASAPAQTQTSFTPRGRAGVCSRTEPRELTEVHTSQEESQEKASSEPADPQPQPQHLFPLHIAVWLADLRRIEELLQDGVTDVNQVDSHGTTPLLLAVELLPRARAYEQVMSLLLERGADPRLQSSRGWAPLDEAVSRGEERLVRILFESTQRNLRERWRKRLESIASSLRLLPDFECKIRWEFESPIASPLVRKIAPSDVLWLRKRGTSLRIDSTLASWKRFRLSKRRDLTTLFRGGDADPSLCMLNHSKQTAVEMSAALDDEETSAVVQDLLAGEVTQWNMQLNSLEVAEATTWLGSAAGPCEVNGWKAVRLDVCGALGVVMRKKGQRGNCMTFQEYFGTPLPLDACLPELREAFRDDEDQSLSTNAPMSREGSRTSGEWPSESYERLETLEGRCVMDALGAECDTLSTVSEVLSDWPLAGVSTASALERDCDSRAVGGALAGVSKASNAGASASQSALSAPSSTRVGRALPRPRRAVPPRRNAPGDRQGTTSRQVSASVWMATDFAIPMTDFLPILEALSLEHEAMRRLKELLASESLLAAAEKAQKAAAAARGPGFTAGGHVFPVRVSVPVNRYALRMLVHFEAFDVFRGGGEGLDVDHPLAPMLFEVPQYYRWLPRHEAQKTPNRAKKRMLLANLAL